MQDRARPFGYIYIVTNTVNGKVYVGQTTETAVRRMQRHRATARRFQKQKRPLSYFHKALLKYPDTLWEIHTQSQCDSKALMDMAERHYITVYHANDRQHGYNLTPGGDGTIGCEPSNKIHIAKEALQTDILNGLEQVEMAAKYGCNRVVIGRKIKQLFGKSLYEVRKDLTGCARTDTCRRAISSTLSNPKHPAYGRKHTEESKRVQSEIKRQWWAQRKGSTAA